MAMIMYKIYFYTLLLLEYQIAILQNKKSLPSFTWQGKLLESYANGNNRGLDL